MKVKISKSTQEEIDLTFSLVTVSGRFLDYDCESQPIISIFMQVNEMTGNSIVPLSSFKDYESAKATLIGNIEELLRHCYQIDKNPE